MACDIDKLIRQIVEFRDQRNWAQFHNPKDLDNETEHFIRSRMELNRLETA